MPSNIIKQQWKEEQIELAKKVEFVNNFDWNLIPSSPKFLKFVGGIDISFPK